MSILGLTNRRVALVASTGGHLEELVRLRPRLDVAPDPLWVTFDTPQSRSLLAGERVAYVPYVAPRDVGGVLRAAHALRGPLRQRDVEAIVSTGAAVALAALPQARSDQRAIYVESVSRFDGPSLTGRLLQRLPGVELHSQHPDWVSGRWQHAFSLLEDYRSQPVAPVDRPLRVLVTLGTIRPYRFDALLDAVERMAGDLGEIVWQTGATDGRDLTGAERTLMPSEEFDAAVRRADVVVSHAGVGSALRALDLGRVPVLVPRRASRHEHVDDHQAQIARLLASRGLAVDVEAPDLTMDHLRRAGALTVSSPARAAA
ncbi:glycosyltransferase [Serinibacter arcticus]|uniref:Glycosyltransferase n=1 Tax=Serinibacter arcticus TaxID=1655435 RepID=A0A2U1ZY73_9MICO|nr:glycosyltransferase [Serinibacter arcticus]PWD51936.1 glycosyltransferase [Serinibacter arcticus]